MKLIITESQYKILTETESTEVLLELDLESYGDNIDDIHKLMLVLNKYERLSKKGNYSGLRLTDSNCFFNGLDWESIPHLKVVDGSLVMRHSKVETLGELELVGRNLVMTDCKYLVSLGELREVKGIFNLENSKILESLDNLEEVGNELVIRGCENLRDLGKLKYVHTISGLDDTMITDLGNLERVGYIYNWEGGALKKIESLGKLKRVDRMLDLAQSKIKSLGNLEYVGDFLSLFDSDIEDLGNLKYVGGNLSLMGTPLAEKTTEEEIRSKINVEGSVYLD